MGTWLNVAFIQSSDTKQVEKELSRLLTEGGRRLTSPKLRIPERYDRMQYGLGDEVQRWGVAGFQGAPGWTVLRTAPFELLMQGTPPLLARLAARLGVPAFQYNIYDTSSEFLLEVDASGRVELSGFVSHDVTRYWNGEPPIERFHTRFRIIDPSAVASWSESARPEARVGGWIGWISSVQSVKGDPAKQDAGLETKEDPFEALYAQQQEEFVRWLEEIGADRALMRLWCRHSVTMRTSPPSCQLG